MATFSFLDITGDGDSGPVRFVECIFIPIPASPPSSSWCAPWSTSLATTTSSLCAARSIFSTYPSLRRPPHYLCSTRSTSSLHFYAALIQGVHCRYPLPRPLSTSAPPASTGAPCHSRTVAIEIVPGASRSTDHITFSCSLMMRLFSHLTFTEISASTSHLASREGPRVWCTRISLLIWEVMSCITSHC